MTDAQILRAITESKDELFIPSNGTEITVELEVDHPPLRLPDKDGHWDLVGWVEYHIKGVWVLEYAYRSEKRYYVAVKVPESGYVEVAGTRGQKHEILQQMVGTLNAATVAQQEDWPFMVKVSNDCL